jgi:hypothetical protein
LAYDFGTKAIQAIGSALDIVLFQIASRRMNYKVRP